ncbi:MAG: aminotransferase class V-fold PLP-dependent enzyme [Alphaproteobacteria bacterium]|nr:aminotransferase class V-fold PLP-dependent enzyme [Alphaproteobacteria bacterium]
MIPCQRALFDIPDDVAYLNCAYMSPLSRAVVAAGERGVRRKARPWEVTGADFFTETETARGLFARVVGARADEIAVVPSASYGVGVAAANLKLAPGKSVLVLEDQFPSNYYAWRDLGPVVAAGPIEGDLTAGILARLDARIGIAALPHCRWTDGALIDLVRVGARCREIGAALVIDATQSLGALPLDVGAVRPDYLVAATYKWLMGPYSLGFLYVAPERHEGRALEQNWIARAGSENFGALVNYRDDFQPGARRYDVGERSNFALMPMAVAALEHILAWGVTEIQATLAATNRGIAARAAGLGLKVAPEALRAGHFLGLGFPKGVPEGLVEGLAQDKVFVSLRGTSLRVTPHLYNTSHDINRLFNVLESFLIRYKAA